MSSSMGRSLQRAKREKAKASRQHYASLLHEQAILASQRNESDGTSSKKQLKSIWETNNMDQFLQIADDREHGYMAERNVRVVVSGAVHVVTKDRVLPQSDDRNWYELSEQLTIPRRPEWSFSTQSEELQRKEKAMFLDWRRSLAKLEESHKVLLTPYEKNLEVWRQLWRVVERSDVLLEILDCRNPLAFRSRDFERYASSDTNKQGAPKKVILLLNKADLLTENQRKAWAAYFAKRGDPFYFFSAKPLDTTVNHAMTELSDDEPLDEEEEEEEEDLELPEEEALVESEDEQVSKLLKNKKEKTRHNSRKLKGAPVQYVNPYELQAMRQANKEAKNAPKPPPKRRAPTKEELNRDARAAEKVAAHLPWDILSAEDLLDHMSLLRSAAAIEDPDTPLVVGMVGYPNVGKSSTINAIMGCKKVVVSATPGKTKHFQTLVIPNERRVMLCDCPGLVFPSFASTREQMICDGVLPIDTVRDYVTPISVICQRIPRQIFEAMYKVSLLPEDDVDDSTSLADRLLHIVARRKGYMTDHDKPNRSKIAKELLKLYVDGVLVFAHPPPGLQLSVPDMPQLSHLRAEQLHEAAEPHHHPKPAKHGDDDAEAGDEEPGDEVWEDISSADEARALSDDGQSYVDSEEFEANAVPPMFFSRAKANELTQQELFNFEHNFAAMPREKQSIGKKKKTNHQLEPETVVALNDDGEYELQIDSDDGIVQFDHDHAPPHMMTKQPKGPSKRKMRRDAKRMGVNVPFNPTTRVVGFQSTV